MHYVRRLTGLLLVTCCVLTLSGCPFLFPGGLREDDFVRISANGFDAEDNAQDLNDYAWSMAHFVPDGTETGHVYVGTGNGIINVVISGLVSLFIGDFPESVPIGIGEIRRYRPDLGPQTWERVFDGRNGPAPLNESLVGFRAMHTYRPPSSGVHYLYALSLNPPALWRTRSGEAGSWELAWQSTQQGQVRAMEVHRGLLYFTVVFNDRETLNRNAQIWATDGEAVFPVIDDGFGNPDNILFASLQSFGGWLYAGSENASEGFELWRLAGPEPDPGPQRILAGGGGEPLNTVASTMTVFNEHLYLGTSWFPARGVLGIKAFDIFRITGAGAAEQIVGHDSVTGIKPGIGNFRNLYCWSLHAHDGWLYAGTFDAGIVVSSLLRGNTSLLPPLGPILDEIQAAFSDQKVKARASQKLEVGTWDQLVDAGADLYKTRDGLTWFPVNRDGLGNPGNYGFRNMLSAGGALFLGTANPYDGLEIWKAAPQNE